MPPEQWTDRPIYTQIRKERQRAARIRKKNAKLSKPYLERTRPGHVLAQDLITDPDLEDLRAAACGCRKTVKRNPSKKETSCYQALLESLSE